MIQINFALREVRKEMARFREQRWRKQRGNRCLGYHGLLAAPIALFVHKTFYEQIEQAIRIKNGAAFLKICERLP